MTQSEPSAETGQASVSPAVSRQAGSEPFWKRIFYPNWFRYLITEADNETVDVKRVAGLLGVCSFFYLAFHAVVINHSPFDAANYGVGLGSILASIGLSIGLGKSGETPIGQ